MSKPSILVLGGVGFIGRNLIVHLVENSLASKIRVVDKVLPQTAWLTERQTKAFAGVEFVQGNLTNAASTANAFDNAGASFDFVINLAAETKYGQTEKIYEEKVLSLSVCVAKEAAKRGVKRFIEVSTAQVYSSDKDASTETDKLNPWTTIAQYKLKAEEAIKGIAGLNYVIVRPAIVYGTGDLLGLTPRLIIGAVYKSLNEQMKLLWTEKLRLNTVHVDDVARALFYLTDHGNSGEIYNLADKGDTSQDTVSTILDQIFGIKHSYAGSIQSNLAKLNMKNITEDVNESHMDPWSKLLKADGIENTPLSPYLDQELLYNNNTTVDGSKIEKLGFSYTQPQLTKDALKNVVDEYVKLGLFPKSIL
ncbi:NAD-dependent epimerase/dehydratase [Capsaspora owczarzaki ATCC 30864]|uniref:NAD-dependent epimerase/dehydratase n=1 Tax=Capsaspora owczarzaki (strain ATCC 30864) TaxID=595528 RepID=A0A0D2X0U7_CAPO3|nr:NAD-dependent epimerase/dehydratase [Capsaspora owczarzaki ATCC 30864]KJE89679.1 NAD-dependent epimerase/dehydratase [Capsaspora owczarzaki ATCC 30864]|eukprot:XP_004365984.1 NAD-dependent epimerase/dehydratase [Capsaspora owczarzaki ATCC 30864]